MQGRSDLPGVGRVDVAPWAAEVERLAHEVAVLRAERNALRSLLNVCLDHLNVHDEQCRLLRDIPKAIKAMEAAR